MGQQGGQRWGSRGGVFHMSLDRGAAVKSMSMSVSMSALCEGRRGAAHPGAKDTRCRAARVRGCRGEGGAWRQTCIILHGERRPGVRRG
jgi:hypothetical protein